MCEKTIKKSETTTKKYIDEWIDGEGKFHRKTIFETITSPMDLNQATFPGGLNPIPTLIGNDKRLGRTSRHPKPFWARPKYPISGMISPGQNPMFCGQIDSKSPERPAIDVKEFIAKGREILSGMGIDVEKEIKNLFTKPKEKSKEESEKKEETLNQKKEVKPWQKNKPLKKQKQRKQNQKIKKK